MSVKGGIEDLLICLGYRAEELGNQNLKPNFYYGSRDEKDFEELEFMTNEISQALESILKSKPKPSIGCCSKKRSFTEAELISNPQESPPASKK